MSYHHYVRLSSLQSQVSPEVRTAKLVLGLVFSMCTQNPEETIPKSNNAAWRPDDNAKAIPAQPGSSELFRPDILETVEAKIAELDSELRELSLDIHGLCQVYSLVASQPDTHAAHPELGYEELCALASI